MFTYEVRESGDGWVWVLRRRGVIIDSGFAYFRENAERTADSEKRWHERCAAACVTVNA